MTVFGDAERGLFGKGAAQEVGEVDEGGDEVGVVPDGGLDDVEAFGDLVGGGAAGGVDDELRWAEPGELDFVLEVSSEDLAAVLGVGPCSGKGGEEVAGRSGLATDEGADARIVKSVGSTPRVGALSGGVANSVKGSDCMLHG